MRTGFLTRAAHFSASHRYHRPDWSDEENERRFGACARPEGHGHNYRCEITVRAPIDPETGMVMDLAELDRVIDSQVVSRFDHRHINLSVGEFGPGAAIPTTENLAAFILEQVAAHLPPGVRVHRVRVQEDRDLWADAYGHEPTG
jgi:6-pyruvoyltetrahydropterin/6-carboxytetrahydropterin synthase